jgi:hypothetical protein
MEVGTKKLILHIVCDGKTFQSHGGLVVQGFKFGFETFGTELLMNVIISFDPFRGGS